MNVGVLTGGGDCPGLNAVIRAITYKGINHYNYNIFGIYEGAQRWPRGTAGD